jgi:hypothetical protein
MNFKLLGLFEANVGFGEFENLILEIRFRGEFSSGVTNNFKREILQKSKFNFFAKINFNFETLTELSMDVLHGSSL